MVSYCQFRCRAIVAFVLATGLLIASAAPAHSAVIIWNSAGATDHWNDGVNWVGGVAPGASDEAKFDNTASGATDGANIVTSGLTVQKLTYGADGLNGTSHATTINSGVTLLVSGDGDGNLNAADFNVGHDLGAAFTGTKTAAVSIGGAGTLQIGAGGTNTADAVIGRRSSSNVTGHATVALDMSGLTTFAANVDEFVVGFNGFNAYANTTLTLATDNTIKANTFNLADSANTGSGVSSIKLGQSNLINANTIYLGHKKSSGTMSFNTGLTNPTLTIANLAGTGGANLYVGLNDAGGTGTATTSLLDASAGTLNATLNNLVIGRFGSGAGNAKGELRMSAGTVTANSVILGDPGTGTIPLNTAGTITMTGGTFTVAGNVADGRGVATLAINGGAFSAGSLSNGGGTLNLNVNGGTATINGNVAGGAGATNLTLTSGTLAINGNITDGAGATSLNVDGSTMNFAGDLAVDNVRVGVDGRTGSLTLSGANLAVGTAAARGTLYVGRRTAETAVHSIGALDLTSSGSFTAYLTDLGVGIGPSGATAQGGAGGTVTLGPDNYMDATNITIAYSPSVGLGSTPSVVHLGAANEIHAAKIVVGGSKGNGTLDFLAPGSTLTLGSPAARVDLWVGDQTGVGTGGGATGMADFRNGTVTAYLDELYLGAKRNDATGTTTGTLSFRDGTMDVNSVVLANRTQAGTSGVVRGTFNLEGGTLTAGSISKSPTNLNTANDVTAFNWTGGTLHVGTFGTASAPFDLNQNGGILAPGQSVGETTIFGDYNQAAAGVLEIEIDSPGVAGVDYDLVTVNGDASLNGQLLVQLTGVAPGLGDVFEILTATDIDAANLLLIGDQPPNSRWLLNVVPGGNGEILQLTAALPEPSSWALLGLGLAGLALIRWRRRA